MQWRKVLLTIGFTVLAYKLMVMALPLMNQPSDRALYAGVLLLLVTATGYITVVALLWRRGMR